MIVVLLASLALASAAPQFGGDFDEDALFSQAVGYGHHKSPFSDDVFDARIFWQELETEMQKFDLMLTDFYKRFPMSTSQAGVRGNEYIITQSLTGFDEKDIKVKAREGVLMIQAVHKLDEGSQRSYLDLKTLPSNVNVNGTWTFENGVLRVVFPLKDNAGEVTVTSTEEASTREPNVEEFERSGEEMDMTKHNENDNQDADVGLTLNRNEDNDILTNVIPRQPVEATTYAVDLKNEVEFVPVKY